MARVAHRHVVLTIPRLLRPHVHLLTTDGARTADGSWHHLPEWDGTLLMRLFREHLLTRLLEAHAISPELVAKLLSSPAADKPPPLAREILRVAEHGEGWGVPADWK